MNAKTLTEARKLPDIEKQDDGEDLFDIFISDNDDLAKLDSADIIDEKVYPKYRDLTIFIHSYGIVDLIDNNKQLIFLAYETKTKILETYANNLVKRDKIYFGRLFKYNLDGSIKSDENFSMSFLDSTIVTSGSGGPLSRLFTFAMF